MTNVFPNPVPNPTAYLGVRATNPPNLIQSTANPGSSNRKYPIGTLWVNTVLNTVWMLSGFSSGVPVWTELDNSSGAGIFTSLTVSGTSALNGNTSVTGSLTASGTISGQSLAATAGGVLVTNGDIALNTLGHKIIVPTGTNAAAGTSAAMSGSPGTVTVATTASSTTALVFYSRKTTGGTEGQVSITAQDGTGFTLTSTANETSTFNWWIINT